MRHIVQINHAYGNIIILGGTISPVTLHRDNSYRYPIIIVITLQQDTHANSNNQR